MCLAKIWPLVFLDSPHHLLDRFWGPQDGDFGFSSGGYQGRGESTTGFPRIVSLLSNEEDIDRKIEEVSNGIEF